MPAQPAEVAVMRALRSCVAHGKGRTRHPAAYQRENDNCELSSEGSSYQAISIWGLESLTLSCATSGYSKPWCQGYQPDPICGQLLEYRKGLVTATDCVPSLVAEKQKARGVYRQLKGQ